MRFYFHEICRIGKSVEAESRLVFARAEGKGEWEVLLMGMGFPSGLQKMFATTLR